MGITASERGEDYTSTKKEVASLVASINAANADLAEPPVLFMERRETEMRLLDRMPLLALADAFIVTSPRDGLNRMPLEFVAAQAATRGVGVGGSAASSRRASAVDLPASAGGEKAGAAGSGRFVSGGGGVGGGSSSPEKGREKEGAAEPTAELPPPPGVCILSEFVSCTRVLLGAMFVNPWEIGETTAQLHKALGMSREERVLRHMRDVGFVNSQTVLNWAYQVCMWVCDCVWPHQPMLARALPRLPYLSVHARLRMHPHTPQKHQQPDPGGPEACEEGLRPLLLLGRGARAALPRAGDTQGVQPPAGRGRGAGVPPGVYVH